MCKFQVSVVKRGEIIVEAETQEQAESIVVASQDAIKWNEELYIEEVQNVSVS